jgi:adenine-specific DNA methylase
MSLCERLPVKHILISYNDESLLSLDTLTNALRAKYSSVIVKKIPYKRNIMAQIGNAALYTTEHKTENVEVLIWVSKL